MRLTIVLILSLLLMLFSACRGSIGYGGSDLSLVETFPDQKSQALAFAASYGNRARIADLIENGADVNALGEGGVTPLWWAAWNKSYVGFTSLLKSGGNPNVIPEEMPSVMDLIINPGFPVKYLKIALSNGGDPNLRDSKGTRLIVKASSRGLKQHLDVLIEHGAEIDLIEGDPGGSALHAAVRSRRLDMALYLLHIGADYSQKDHRGDTIADYLEVSPYGKHTPLYQTREEIVEFLNSKGVSVQRPPEGK